MEGVDIYDPVTNSVNQPVLKKWLPGFWIATMTDVASVFARLFPG